MRYIRCLCVILSVLAATPSGAARITVYAAASLQTALDRVAADWAGATGDTVIPVYDGSARLARQIVAGAPADIYISASPEWMDFAEAQGAVAADTRRDILGNTLVLIAPANRVLTDPLVNLAAGLDDRPLAMGNVDTVPAGIYGKAALTSLGQWDAVAPRVVQTGNVRVALALVALGEAGLGIVYASDARVEPRVRIVATFAADSHPPIIYPAALTAEANPAARAFLDYLTTPPAQAVFVAEGFTGAPE